MPSASTPVKAGSVAERFRTTRCGPTAGRVRRRSSTSSCATEPPCRYRDAESTEKPAPRLTPDLRKYSTASGSMMGHTTRAWATVMGFGPKSRSRPSEVVVQPFQRRIPRPRGLFRLLEVEHVPRAGNDDELDVPASGPERALEAP